MIGLLIRCRRAALEGVGVCLYDAHDIVDRAIDCRHIGQDQ